MKFFIGVPIPKNYKSKIEMLRAEINFFSTEPHITLIPPPALPDDDSFVKKIIALCKNTKSFQITLDKLGQFGKRVLYIGVNSPELIQLHDIIYDELNLEREKRAFTPHLTVVKQRPGRSVDIEAIKKRAETMLIPCPKFNLKSIVIYIQPKEKSIYVPYMVIPLKDEE